MSGSKEIAKLLGRGHKRLMFWKSSLSESMLTPAQWREVNDLFATYTLLLSRAEKSISEEDLSETKRRLADTERRLTRLADEARLVTNRIPNVESKPKHSP